MTDRTRWAQDGPERSQWYVERFRRLAAEGVDLAGEARLVDAMLPRGAR
ncbi:MAG: SAM-dependent methyltransferase, partial [Actinomycetota bacterium]|nr:SAM-dependent methyltransferase [Actinomycetota bacterium]